jgi:hypothetical protein
MGLGHRHYPCPRFYYAAMIASTEAGRGQAERRWNGFEHSISVRAFRGLWLSYARRMFFPVTIAILSVPSS